MQETKIKVVSNVMINIHPGVELDAIVKDDVVYLPAFNLPQVQATAKVPPAAPLKEAAPAKEAAPDEKGASDTAEAPTAKAPAPAASGKSYTEDELKDLPSDDVRAIAEGMGIDVEAEFAKSGSKRMTNKFLRELVLSAQESGSTSEAPAESEQAPAEETGDLDDDALAELLEQEAMGIFNALDSEEYTPEKAKSAMFDLVMKHLAVEDKEEQELLREDLKSLIDEFFEDADKPLEDFAKDFVSIAFGEDVEEGEISYDDAKTVDPKTLKKGQKVAVFWNDGQGWAEGEVQSVSRRGGAQIKYTDGEVAGVNDATTKFVLL